MSIANSITYDMDAIVDSGDLGLLVIYTPVDGFPVSTKVILDNDIAESSDGYVKKGYIRAVILISDVTDPQSGDTFLNETTLEQYKVEEIIGRTNFHASALVKLTNETACP